MQASQNAVRAAYGDQASLSKDAAFALFHSLLAKKIPSESSRIEQVFWHLESSMVAAAQVQPDAELLKAVAKREASGTSHLPVVVIQTRNPSPVFICSFPAHPQARRQQLTPL